MLTLNERDDYDEIVVRLENDHLRLSVDGELEVLGLVHYYLGWWRTGIVSGSDSIPTCGLSYEYSGDYCVVPVRKVDAQTVSDRLLQILQRSDLWKPDVSGYGQ